MANKKLNLPKNYLSFSSMSLWKGSKNSFRRKYYSSEEYNINTPFTEFGKEIAETLEDKEATAAHPVLSQIPTYDVAEYAVEIDIDEVPIKGFLDGYDPVKKRILEYKTAIRKKDGRAPWDQVKVRKHEQLLLYSLLIEEEQGEVDPVTTLVWMETEWAALCEEKKFNGETFQTCHPGLRLTGHFEVFEREIKPWERLRMRQLIRKTAEEISEDYTNYQKTYEKKGSARGGE